MNRNATRHTANNGKPWKRPLLRHVAIAEDMTIAGLAGLFLVGHDG